MDRLFAPFRNVRLADSLSQLGLSRQPMLDRSSGVTHVSNSRLVDFTLSCIVLCFTVRHASTLEVFLHARRVKHGRHDDRYSTGYSLYQKPTCIFRSVVVKAESECRGVDVSTSNPSRAWYIYIEHHYSPRQRSTTSKKNNENGPYCSLCLFYRVFQGMYDDYKKAL